MYSSIKRMVRRALADLTLENSDFFGRVVAVADNNKETVVSTFARPFYAVDVQRLNQYGKPLEDEPLLRSLPLPVAGAGAHGVDIKPVSEGALVLVGFAFGSPAHPIVKAVYPEGCMIPSNTGNTDVSGDQGSAFDKREKGNWFRFAINKISEHSASREIKAGDNLESFVKDDKKVIGESVETLGAKVIKSFGAVRLFSGAVFNISALGNLNLTTKDNRHDFIGKNYSSVIGGDCKKEIKGSTSEIVAGDKLSKAVNIKLDANKIYLGNSTAELVDLILQLTDMVTAVDAAVVGHSHGVSGAATNLTTYATQATSIAGIKTKITSLKYAPPPSE